jgi:protein ImuB
MGCAGRKLAEPIATTGAVQQVLLHLLTEICARFEKEQLGARRLNLDCYRVDGTVASCHVSTSKPVRSVTHLMRLFAEKLDTLDAGFGIETLILTVPNIEAADPVQLTLPQFDHVEEEAPLDGLIDRLGARLGFQHVCRFRICESLLPEYAIEFRPVTAPIIPLAEWPENRVRPVRLIDPPMRIEVSAMLPGESPVQFRIGRQMHRIVKAEGPERLTPEWWRDECLSWKTRDYYRVEDDKSARFWIFREMKLALWFLHGHLP